MKKNLKETNCEIIAHDIFHYILLYLIVKTVELTLGFVKFWNTVKPRFTVPRPDLPGPSIYWAPILSPENKLYV